MLKSNNLKYLLYVVLAVLFCTADVAVARGNTALPSTKSFVIKIILAMGGVGISTLLLFGGLSLYNRFFVATQLKDFKLSKESLRNPMDKNDAVMMFITKNRLK